MVRSWQVKPIATDVRESSFAETRQRGGGVKSCAQMRARYYISQHARELF